MKQLINYLPPKHRQYQDVISQLYPEFIQQGKRVSTITFQVTEDCCMACTYCYQHNKTKNKMDFNTAKKFIDALLNDEYDCVNTNNSCAVIFDFIGGEPLMEIELITQICDYLLNQMISLRHPWLFLSRLNIGSNGLLYDSPKVQEFFKQYANFCGFTISIDGDKNLHDSCRVDLNGNGTYDRAIAAVHQHRKKYGKNPETKLTISPENVKYISNAIISLINEGYTSIMGNCVYENVWNESHAKILYAELKILSDYLLNNDLYNKVFIRMFDEVFYQPLPESDNTNWCGGVDNICLSINHTGNLYPCLRYMDSSLNGKQEPIIVGDIYNGYGITELHKNNIQKITGITRRSQSTDKCFNCPIAGGCSWCSAYNYEEFGTPNKRATYICIMHQAMALANTYHWNRLYQKLQIDKIFPLNTPKDWALNIIDIEEYNYLNKLSKGDILS